MIRLANKFDIKACTEMLRMYSAESSIAKLKNAKHHDDKYVEQLLLSLIVGRGFIYLDDEYKGLIVAIITPNFWCPGVYEVRELAWWVHPNHRNGTLGGRLFLAFNKHADRLIEEGRAHIVTASLMASSPKIDLQARGFVNIESTFCKE